MTSRHEAIKTPSPVRSHRRSTDPFGKDSLGRIRNHETRTSRVLGRVAGWILPQIVGRPLSSLRCPSGMAAKCFFAKHPWQGVDDGVNRVDTGDKESVVVVDDLAGLKASPVPGLPPPTALIASPPPFRARSKRCDTTNRNAIISLVFRGDHVSSCIRGALASPQ